MTELLRRRYRALMNEVLQVPVVKATRENTAPYGHFVGTELPSAGLSIPYYKEVEEGYNLPFEYNGKAVIRMARIHPRSGDVRWLERHTRLTQLFIGLGDAPFALVLGKPCPEPVPDLDQVVCFLLPPGHGILLHRGTWHDFPFAMDRPVTVLIANSEEVVAALAAQKQADEMDGSDVYKIDIAKRTGRQLRVSLP